MQASRDTIGYLHNYSASTPRNMSTQYLLVSLPTSIAQSNDYEESLEALRSTVTVDYGTTYPFTIPELDRKSVV